MALKERIWFNSETEERRAHNFKAEQSSLAIRNNYNTFDWPTLCSNHVFSTLKPIPKLILLSWETMTKFISFTSPLPVWLKQKMCLRNRKLQVGAGLLKEIVLKNITVTI